MFCNIPVGKPGTFGNCPTAKSGTLPMFTVVVGPKVKVDDEGGLVGSVPVSAVPGLGGLADDDDEDDDGAPAVVEPDVVFAAPAVVVTADSSKGCPPADLTVMLVLLPPMTSLESTPERQNKQHTSEMKDRLISHLSHAFIHHLPRWIVLTIMPLHAA